MTASRIVWVYRGNSRQPIGSGADALAKVAIVVGA